MKSNRRPVLLMVALIAVGCASAPPPRAATPAAISPTASPTAATPTAAPAGETVTPTGQGGGGVTSSPSAQSGVTPTAHPSTPTTIPAPPAKTCDSHPSVTVTSSASSIKVGETLTLSAQVRDVGEPNVTLTLSSGASATLLWDSTHKPESTDDSVFAVVSVEGSPYGVQFILRGKTTGSSKAFVSANGELGCFDTGYSWGNAQSDPLLLEVRP